MHLASIGKSALNRGYYRQYCLYCGNQFDINGFFAATGLMTASKMLMEFWKHEVTNMLVREKCLITLDKVYLIMRLKVCNTNWQHRK